MSQNKSGAGLALTIFILAAFMILNLIITNKNRNKKDIYQDRYEATEIQNDGGILRNSTEFPELSEF